MRLVKSRSIALCLLGCIATIEMFTSSASSETVSAQPASVEADNFDGSWCTAASKHFVIYTYGGARVARRTLQDAEQIYQALRLSFGASEKLADDQPPLRIVLFASDYAYKVMVGRHSDGLFRPGLSWGESDFVFLRKVGQFAVLRHELTHRLIREYFPSAPPWLDEGLASYYQWMRISDDDIRIGSSKELHEVQAKLHDSPYFPSLSQLLSLPRSGFYGQRSHGLYSASFWLIETLHADAAHRVKFQQMLKDIAHGIRADKAWQKAFSVEETQRLDAAYKFTREQGAPTEVRMPWQAPRVEVSEPRLITRAEQHILIARILGRDKGFVARRELDTALQNDAKHAEALAQRALLDAGHLETQRQDAEQATAFDEKLPLAWQALALSHLSRPIAGNEARVRVLAKRLEPSVESTDSRCLAALLFASLGERVSAFNLARDIVRVWPRSLTAQVVLSYIARVAGRTKDADAALQAAWALCPDGVTPSRIEALLLPQARATQAGAVTLEFNADKTAAIASPSSTELAQIQQRIANFWRPPASLRALTEAEHAREGSVITTLHIVLDEKGHVSANEPAILSGIAELDEAAFAAINSAQPFATIPPGVTFPYRIRLRFSVPLAPPAAR